jgi:hypothetical protein
MEKNCPHHLVENAKCVTVEEESFNVPKYPATSGRTANQRRYPDNVVPSTTIVLQKVRPSGQTLKIVVQF